MKNFELINLVETIATWVAIYFTTWWVVIYMILPLGVKVPKKVKKGHATSAPEKPKLKEKFIITSVISFFITSIFFILSYFKIVDFEWLLFGVKSQS